MKKSKSTKRRQSNALKHGAFVTEIFIFEEDWNEFERLHNELVEEFRPSGRMEEEIVLEIAKLRWRKLRIEQFYVHEADLLRAHPGEEGMEKLATNKRSLTKETPCHAIWKQIRDLPAPMFKVLEALVKAPTKEIDEDWIERFKKSAEYVYRNSHNVIAHQRKGLRFLGEPAAKLMDLSAKRIAIEERLDAMIDRALKRLAQLKTFKEVVAAKEAAAPRRISGR
jgi:hypothetical protein